jgi:uncharacterized protein (DUF58 family)
MESSNQSRFLSRQRSALALRAERWARARQGEDSLPVTLQARRVYILPTKAGISAAVLLFVMLLAGMNYNNSLALLLCFILCGVTLVSMHECHRTMSGLKLLRVEAESTFAGHQGALVLLLENSDSRIRSALSVRSAPCEASEFQLLPGDSKTVRVAFQAAARGIQRIDRLQLMTQAPLGLFRAWSWLYLPLDVVIYPAPNGSRVLPPRQGEPRRGRRRIRDNGDEEWAWLRAFQDSDPPRSVAWKAYARGAPLMVSHYESPAGLQRILNLDQLHAQALEQKLSQLSLWILECERQGEQYALQLPERSQAAGHGNAHRRLCLEALALYGL